MYRGGLGSLGKSIEGGLETEYRPGNYHHLHLFLFLQVNTCLQRLRFLLYLYVNLLCFRVVFPSFTEWWAIIKLVRCAWAWWNTSWRDTICGTRSCTRKTRLISFYDPLFGLSAQLQFVCEVWALTHFFFARESAPENGSLRKDQDLALRKYKGLLAKQEQLLRGMLSTIQVIPGHFDLFLQTLILYMFNLNIFELLLLERFTFSLQTCFFSLFLWSISLPPVEPCWGHQNRTKDEE